MKGNSGARSAACREAISSRAVICIPTRKKDEPDSSVLRRVYCRPILRVRLHLSFSFSQSVPLFFSLFLLRFVYLSLSLSCSRGALDIPQSFHERSRGSEFLIVAVFLPSSYWILFLVAVAGTDTDALIPPYQWYNRGQLLSPIDCIYTHDRAESLINVCDIFFSRCNAYLCIYNIYIYILGIRLRAPLRAS